MKVLRERAGCAVRSVVLAAGGVVALLWWRGPAWSGVVDAFTAVEWHWVAAAVGLNLLSVLAARGRVATVIVQAMPPPHPSFPLVFSAFSSGCSRTRSCPGGSASSRASPSSTGRCQRRGMWPTLLGTVFAHRVFDLVAMIVLILYVALTAHIPDWAVTSLIVVVVVGVRALHDRGAGRALPPHADASRKGSARFARSVRLARYGLGVMRRPGRRSSSRASSRSSAGPASSFAVYTTMRAFGIHEPLPAAGSRARPDERRDALPALARQRRPRAGGRRAAARRATTASPRRTGIAFGFGLQAIEASVGVGVGLIFLAREGLSFAMLKVMPDVAQADVPEDGDDRRIAESDAERAHARVSG